MATSPPRRSGRSLRTDTIKFLTPDEFTRVGRRRAGAFARGYDRSHPATPPYVDNRTAYRR